MVVFPGCFIFLISNGVLMFSNVSTVWFLRFFGWFLVFFQGFDSRFPIGLKFFK